MSINRSQKKKKKQYPERKKSNVGHDYWIDIICMHATSVASLMSDSL